MRKTTGNLALTGYDDIFNSSAPALVPTHETVSKIPIAELHPPEFHPFQVLNDEAMTRLVNSVKEYGVREPGVARPRTEGGYELIAGNRRKRACELAGIDTMPVIIRTLDDDSAAIAMVDSNLEQRETLLYSERAWAYRVKLEALNHRGARSDMPGQLSVDILCEQTGESKNQIFRLVRLTELVPALLDKVDARQLAFNPAVELSYLSRSEQSLVVDAMARYEVRPSLSQAVRLKKMAQAGELTANALDAVFAENVKSSKPDKEVDRWSKYFPPDYTAQQMDEVISNLLWAWQIMQNRA